MAHAVTDPRIAHSTSSRMTRRMGRCPRRAGQQPRAPCEPCYLPATADASLNEDTSIPFMPPRVIMLPVTLTVFPASFLSWL